MNFRSMAGNSSTMSIATPRMQLSSGMGSSMVPALFIDSARIIGKSQTLSIIILERAVVRAYGSGMKTVSSRQKKCESTRSKWVRRSSTGKMVASLGIILSMTTVIKLTLAGAFRLMVHELRRSLMLTA